MQTKYLNIIATNLQYLTHNDAQTRPIKPLTIHMYHNLLHTVMIHDFNLAHDSILLQNLLLKQPKHASSETKWAAST